MIPQHAKLFTLYTWTTEKVHRENEWFAAIVVRGIREGETSLKDWDAQMQNHIATEACALRVYCAQDLHERVFRELSNDC